MTTVTIEEDETRGNDRPPSYSGSGSERRDSVAVANIFFNEAITSFTGKLATSYLSRQQRSNTSILNPFGSSIIQLPPDLEVAKKSLVTTISALYAMTIIVLCVVFTGTELLTEKVPLDYFESYGFNTYLYSVSVGFMLYLFFYVLRVRYSGRQGQDDFDVDDFIRRMTQATGLSVQEVESQTENGPICGRRFSIRPPPVSSESQSRVQGGSSDEKHEMYVKLMTSENEKSHGSLFLRIGAIAFGLGTLIYTGLEFLSFFEMPKTCSKWNILMGVNPVLYMIFVFMQMYYIFNHARLNVNKNKVVAKFGMMHLIATNVCIVFRTLVKETLKEFAHADFAPEKEALEDDCKKLEIIGDAAATSSVYLFPFIIEYSIIGIEVIYSMWKHIGKNPQYILVGESEEQHKNKTHREALDWSSSSFGLFLGLLSLVTLIITLILYFTLIDKEEYRLISVLVNNVTDSVINILMIVAMFIGFCQIRKMTVENWENDLDVVMIITVFGVVVYCIFTIIAGCLNDQSFEPAQLVVTNGICEFLEANIQLLFITDLKHKHIDLNFPESKPGRQAVTFLMICNIGLWITYNFEIQKVNAAPDQVDFYGILPWIVIQRFTLPLCVFFRFHSAVVLAELWKNCYRVKKKDS